MTRIKPRKVPRQHRSAATVEAILEAAARILERGGLDALNTNSVAAMAGVSVGSLYQYFPGKEALLAELVRKWRALLVERIEAVRQDPPDTLDALAQKLINAAVLHQLSRPALARTLDDAEVTLPLQAETVSLNLHLSTTIADLLRAHGLARPDEAARDLVALTKGMIDAAGALGEVDSASLSLRVHRAAMGYLQPSV
jgi:AcrR family transcriptional regulator